MSDLFPVIGCCEKSNEPFCSKQETGREGQEEICILNEDLGEKWNMVSGYTFSFSGKCGEK
jgi:hypothetical protein